MAPSDRNNVIDAGRGFAVALVLAFHYTVRWTPPMHARDLYGFDAVFSPLLEYGKFGVHIFFIISGLVIAMTVLRAKGALDFAVKRFARIMPAFVVGALFTLILCQFGPVEFRRTVFDFFTSLTFSPDTFGGRNVDGAYWSLSYELRFYGWVAIAFLLLRQRFWIGLIVPALLSMAPLQGKAYWALMPGVWPLFLTGIAAWYALFERKLVPAAVLAVAAAILFVDHNDGLWPTLFILGSAAMMFGLILVNARVPLLPWLGRISYSLYLVHQFVGVMLIGWLTAAGAPDLVAIAVATGVMVLVAWAMYAGVENPGRRLVMRLYDALRLPARTKPAAASA